MTGATIRSVIALGSNLGARDDRLDRAVAALRDLPGVRVVAVSPWIESIAHTLAGPDPDAPRYLNGVALIDTQLSAEQLLAELHGIEHSLGRPLDHAKWADRTLDLDIIAFGDQLSSSPELTLPHPRAHERVFVLAPWAEIDPDAVLPGHGRVVELLAAADPAERAALQRYQAGAR